ncbi:demethylmenaquinone methyltransferase [Edaphobacter acidisoli]|uniref:Demethylmenaquinone methyltransferase n=1 Tax=Edaphobacter acidisoli TaxID=2040573 RepID=A0A916RZX9_9BACT|nr:bifunctional demethylmenaquinone methyltransferase/2-methoxy-6-polyprenyl-1,4-benzoquinol methylase UbiE [Edaphobacter acidisoli]GGA78515.1 demethylmenaquinone methyltransferase [Edaphobacter acidisoli]
MTQTKPEHELSTGARPTGTTDEATAAANVREMFDAIAPTYDRANHIISAGIDRRWWSRTARTFREVLARPEAVALDLCCGTGDMTLALYKYRPTAPNAAAVLAIDFSHQMLALSRKKFGTRNIMPIEADALHLPVADNSVDLITCAYGFRNLANYEEGLAELHRVLRPGGQIGILECNQPEGLTGTLYNLYFKFILPHLGGLITGNAPAYSYLNASVVRFPRPPRMLQLIESAGFTQATWTRYTLGAIGLYRAHKP